MYWLRMNILEAGVKVKSVACYICKFVLLYLFHQNYMLKHEVCTVKSLIFLQTHSRTVPNKKYIRKFFGSPPRKVFFSSIQLSRLLFLFRRGGGGGEGE